MQEVTLDSTIGKLNTVRIGEGRRTLVMFHGVTRRWQTYTPIVGALAPFWNVCGLDFRGHGKSERASAYRVIDYVEDAAAVIESFDTPVYVYGHSLGAMVAAAVAGQVGSKVAGVILEDPPMHTMGQRIGESVLQSHFENMQRFAGDTRPAAKVAAELAEVQLSDPVTGASIRLGDTRDATNLRFSANCLRHLDPKVLQPIVAGQWLEGYDVDAVCSELTQPTLLLQADAEVGGMLTDADAANICRLAGEVTHIKVSQCGHSIHWSQTSQLLAHVFGFLSGYESE